MSIFVVPSKWNVPFGEQTFTRYEHSKDYLKSGLNLVLAYGSIDSEKIIEDAMLDEDLIQIALSNDYSATGIPLFVWEIIDKYEDLFWETPYYFREEYEKSNLLDTAIKAKAFLNVPRNNKTVLDYMECLPELRKDDPDYVFKKQSEIEIINKLQAAGAKHYIDLTAEEKAPYELPNFIQPSQSIFQAHLKTIQQFNHSKKLFYLNQLGAEFVYAWKKEIIELPETTLKFFHKLFNENAVFLDSRNIYTACISNKFINTKNIAKIIEIFQIDLNSFGEEKLTIMDRYSSDIANSNKNNVHHLLDFMKFLSDLRAKNSHELTHFTYSQNIDIQKLIHDSYHKNKFDYAIELLNNAALSKISIQKSLDQIINMSTHLKLSQNKEISTLMNLALQRGATLNHPKGLNWLHVFSMIDDSYLGSEKRSEQLQMIKFLTEFGANINITDKLNRTPLELAYKYKKAEHIKLIKSLGGIRYCPP